MRCDSLSKIASLVGKPLATDKATYEKTKFGWVLIKMDINQSFQNKSHSWMNMETWYSRQLIMNGSQYSVAIITCMDMNRGVYEENYKNLEEERSSY